MPVAICANWRLLLQEGQGLEGPLRCHAFRDPAPDSRDERRATDLLRDQGIEPSDDLVCTFETLTARKTLRLQKSFNS